MIAFKYESINRDGTITKGKTVCINKEALEDELARKGEVLVKCAKTFDIKQKLGYTGVKLRDIIIFTRQLAVMMQAGVNLQTSIDLISSGTENEKLKSSLIAVGEDLKAGVTLSDSMYRTGIFDDFLVGLVKIAEVSGSIDEVMGRAADYYESEGVLRKKIKSAITYPIILLVLAIGVVTFLILGVVPVFSGLFADMGITDLPAMSKLVIGISDFLVAYGIFLLLGIIGAIIFVINFFRVEENRKLLDAWVLTLPLVGILIKKITAARFARSMDILLKSGVTIMETFDLVDWIIGNMEIRKRLNNSRDVVAAGKTYTMALQQADAFPEILVNMVKVGEETGSLETVLDKTSVFFEQEAESAIEAFIRALEPIILIIIAVLILFIVLAVFLPMFDLYNAI